MIFERFYHAGLAHASYLVGCPGAGEAVVIDPNRDVARYLEAAAQHGLRITAIAETHIHSDYVSGARELSAATGATMYLSNEGSSEWKYGFEHDPHVKLVQDGDTLQIGNVRLDVCKTEGHTPEHIAFIMTDESLSPEPLGAFTGDFIFVGDVGRPDLLEQAAGLVGTQEPGARALYSSIQSWARFPDHLLIWPSHGAGSACGKSLGGVPVSSLGYERLTNWGFKVESEDEFVKEVLSGQPEPPAYFAEMKRLNKVGAPILGQLPTPAHRQDIDLLTPDPNRVVVDFRTAPEFAEGHVPGSLFIPLARQFVTWVGSLLPYERDILLVAANAADAERAAREMAMIGLDRVVGWFGPAELSAYAASGGALEKTQLGTAAQVNEKGVVLDVRNASEWDRSHLEGARHIPLGSLARRAAELPADTRLLIHCAGGTRAVIAASVLQQAGFSDVLPLRATYAEIAEVHEPRAAAN
ncbi:MAG: MBL fold metallo-hydrolase [Fimbriimonadaceae bacterium]|nr:MBL fold metallo-hydrolase [Fimbriimonadaceae bacterium]QYK56336.1 MAG: MBL fold metallo-hydrolase [Fimbriimonadaceae bacterium]